MLTRTLRFMNSTSKTSASFKSFLKHHEAAWFRWVREDPSKKTSEWHWEESTPSLNFRFSRYLNLQSPHIPSTSFCFFGKTNWAVSWEAHKQRGTGLTQSWGMLGAKLCLCRMYFTTSGLLILPCHEDTAPGALTPSSFPAPSSSLSWSGGRQNYLQRSLLLFHCLNPASNHPAATSKIIHPTTSTCTQFMESALWALFNHRPKVPSSSRWHRNMCTPSAPGALIPWQWIHFHSCSLSAHSK